MVWNAFANVAKNARDSLSGAAVKALGWLGDQHPDLVPDFAYPLMRFHANRGGKALDDLNNLYEKHGGFVDVIHANHASSKPRHFLLHFYPHEKEPQRVVDLNALKQDPDKVLSMGLGETIFRLPEHKMWLNPVANRCAGSGFCGPVALHSRTGHEFPAIVRRLGLMEFEETGDVQNAMNGTATEPLKRYARSLGYEDVLKQPRPYTPELFSEKYPDSFAFVNFAGGNHILNVKDGLPVESTASLAADHKNIIRVEFLMAPTGRPGSGDLNIKPDTAAKLRAKIREDYHNTGMREEGPLVRQYHPEVDPPPDYELWPR